MPASRSLVDAAARVGLSGADLVPWGPRRRETRTRGADASPRLVLVSVMTPTPAGEGKTTTSIGLADALTRLGECACLALREPSLGLCLGRKGGGPGGGAAQLIPADRNNVHFRGDFHTDLLESCVAFARSLGLDGEQALREANARPECEVRIREAARRAATPEP